MSKPSLARSLAKVCLLLVAAAAVGFVAHRFRPEPHLDSNLPRPEEISSFQKQLDLAPPVTGARAMRLPENAPVGRVSRGEVQAAVASGRNVIIDARSETEYLAGFIPGAVNIRPWMFAKDYAEHQNHLEKNREALIIVYCSDLACGSSKTVADALLSIGYPDVRIYPEGWEEWIQQEAPSPQ